MSKWSNTKKPYLKYFVSFFQVLSFFQYFVGTFHPHFKDFDFWLGPGVISIESVDIGIGDPEGKWENWAWRNFIMKYSPAKVVLFPR